MGDFLQTLAQQLGVSASALALVGVGVGTFIVLVSLFGARSQPDPVLERMRGRTQAAVGTSPARSELVRDLDHAPKGLAKTFVPQTEEERSLIRLKLSQAGYQGKNAVRNYFLLRMVLGVVIPMAVLAVIVLGHLLNLPEAIDQRIGQITSFQALQIVGGLIAVGFYGPSYWLRSRLNARKERLQQEFPNVLDLLQVSVEAGMGLDAAMQRVAREMSQASPELANEFLKLQEELMAGRDRASAMYSMARRTGIDEATSFTNVVLQSMQYGSSISEALQTYAYEMRLEREMRAQEKANKLPVQMSGVLASLMLPALLMITVGPVVIRYVRFFGGG